MLIPLKLLSYPSIDSPFLIAGLHNDVLPTLEKFQLGPLWNILPTLLHLIKSHSSSVLKFLIGKVSLGPTSFLPSVQSQSGLHLPTQTISQPLYYMGLFFLQSFVYYLISSQNYSSQKGKGHDILHLNHFIVSKVMLIYRNFISCTLHKESLKIVFWSFVKFGLGCSIQ